MNSDFYEDIKHQIMNAPPIFVDVHGHPETARSTDFNPESNSGEYVHEQTGVSMSEGLATLNIEDNPDYFVDAKLDKHQH